MKTSINMEPTWGEVGNLLFAFALSGEKNAVQSMRPIVAKAFAGAEALKALVPQLTDEQRILVKKVMADEMAAQGVVA